MYIYYIHFPNWIPTCSTFRVPPSAYVNPSTPTWVGPWKSWRPEANNLLGTDDVPIIPSHFHSEYQNVDPQELS